MPAPVEAESIQPQPTSDPQYSVTQQEVELDVDFKSRKLAGRATIIIEPLSKDLKSVSLGCRAINVQKITVDNLPVKVPRYRDPYAGFGVREGYGVQQFHQIRGNIHDALQEDPTPNLLITFPKQLRVQELNTNDVAATRAAHLDGAVEAALASNLEDGEAMFIPITIVVDYTVEDSRDGLQWVGLRDGDSRYPHVYTCASSLPGSLPCFVFPYLGSPTTKYSWKVAIRCARTLGDLEWQSGAPAKNSEELINGAHGDVMDVDAQECDFLRNLSNEEKSRDVLAICSGAMEDSDAPNQDGDHLRRWIFQCSVPVAPVHIGFAIGPFEEVDFSEFRESGKEDQLKDHAVGVRGYCLPGRADELRNTCLPLQMAVDSFMQSYISYPFAPECQTYKMCFVDDLAQDVVDTATLSLCSSRLLFPETIVDGVYENSRILIRAAASQWIGVFVTPKEHVDYWVVVGASFFMAENFMATLWGRNELRYRQKMASDLVKIKDRGMTSIHEAGKAVSLDPAELEFIELKAPLVLFHLHQRLVKLSSAVGVVRILTRMLSDARSGRLTDNEIWTDRFLYTAEKVAHSKLASFFDQWVFGAGFPSFLVSQQFQKKKFSVAITIKQTQKLEVQNLQDANLQSGNFMREVKEMEHEIYAPPLQEAFTGPMTIRVHEPNGMPYEQIVEIRDGETKVEFHYNSKNRNQLRKRRQKEKEAAAEGRAHVTEDGDDFVPTYSLGDVLTSPAEMAEWKLVGYDTNQESQMENSSYEWVRIDKDFEWIANVSFHPGSAQNDTDFMHILQLQGDNDVVAHLEALQRLSALTPSPLLSSVFVRTLMDSRYFYGVRVKAAEALVNSAIADLDFVGLFHLQKAFQRLFCFENSPMTRPNDFSDLRLYQIRCAIVRSMAMVRDSNEKAPVEVKQFFLDKLKFNDNSNNQYSDSYYVAFLISGLTRTLTSSYGGMSFSFDDDPLVEAAEGRLKRAALAEIERMRRIDEWIPSYRNVHTRAALRGLSDLMHLKIIPKRMGSLLPYTRPGNQDDVRLEAFGHLIALGMMANDFFLRYIFTSLANEPSASLRHRLWQKIHLGLALVALGDTRMGGDGQESAQSDGLAIDTGQTLTSRNEAIERATPEGALKWLRKQMGSNSTLQEALLEALKSPIIGLKDFNELLDICSYLYDPVDSLPVKLKYPRYWRAEHLGKGKLRLFHSKNFRTKPLAPKIDLKRKRPSEEMRSASPDAKRRQGSSVKLNFTGTIKSKPIQEAAPSLPSPTTSQPPAALSVTIPPSAPVRQDLLKPKTPKAAAPKPRKQSPAVVKKQPPAIVRGSPALSRGSSAKGRPSPALSQSRASSGRPPSRGKNITVLKFNQHRAEFAAMAALVGESPSSTNLSMVQPDSPVLPHIKNGVHVVKPETMELPLAAIPAAAPATTTPTTNAPKKPGIKLKIKLSGGQKGRP